MGYSTPGPRRQLVVTRTFTVGLFELLGVSVVGFDVFGTGEEVPVGIMGEGVSVDVPVGVSVTSSVLVAVAVSVGVWEGVGLGRGSLVAVNVDLS